MAVSRRRPMQAVRDARSWLAPNALLAWTRAASRAGSGVRTIFRSRAGMGAGRQYPRKYREGSKISSVESRSSVRVRLLAWPRERSVCGAECPRHRACGAVTCSRGSGPAVMDNSRAASLPVEQAEYLWHFILLEKMPDCFRLFGACHGTPGLRIRILVHQLFHPAVVLIRQDRE